ncbi:hypothetical protein PLICRDRAFT_172796 [Plicaturopsis crispa FD-325 SS-3]|nr:hypothetical protein PLICRDRAFT_172796 [Plicaturopsis crispa FD-325 SS-3]
MALPMLVSGADCGPSNPLQGLSKQFDRDRGIQQDHFGSARAGPSRETFRTQQAAAPGLDQDAARFFGSQHSPAPQINAPTPFDFAALRGSLPATRLQSPVQSSAGQQNALGAWASDFMQQQPRHSPAPQMIMRQSSETQQETVNPQQQQAMAGMSGGMQWTPSYQGYRMNSMPSFAPALTVQQQPTVQTNHPLWDKEFQSHETAFIETAPAPETVHEQPQKSYDPQQRPIDQDDLARTAGLLVQAVSHEENPKFQKSEFMGLMKQLRDRMIIVDGNQMVENDGSTTSSAPLGTWTREVRTDVKGKGKARQMDTPGTSTEPMLMMRMPGFEPGAISNAGQFAPAQAEDETDVYFRQENEEFTRYWNAHSTPAQQRPSASADSAAWDRMQQDWDHFEATASGIKAVDSYQFQAANPYLIGNSSRTRHHMMHLNSPQTFYENVLELEAAVQRDPTNAGAWFELGVKQQENERESKALQALQRAVELDPTHLPTWLALAVSYTNDGNRMHAYESINAWVGRNEKYASAVQEFRAQRPERTSASTSERFTHLIDCLIAMARSDPSGAIDADIQIALAVLLNTNEDYEKAQDCFRTALAVRPDDWLLYNRVGATMANSGRAEEALQYYYRALELNPSYIRARFNLGISCINLRRYEEAAQHILDALVLQDSDGVHDAAGANDGRGVTSTALWDSLKTTCMHMQRIDLATFCDRHDLEGFRSTFQG